MLQRIHPFAIALVGAIILVLIGIFVIESRRPVSPGQTVGFWGADSGYIDPVPRAPLAESGAQSELQSSQIENNTGTIMSSEVLIIPKASTTTPIVRAIPQTAQDDFQRLLARIKEGSDAFPQTKTSVTALEDAFSFVPRVVITVPTQALRTPEQQALYDYGNTIGTHIRGFSLLHTNMTEILSAQVLDRGNAQKNSAVRTLGSEYVQLGIEIASVQNVPPTMTQAHDLLVKAYSNLGLALSRVPDASGDQEFINAITAYNNTADAYTNAYIGISTMFSLKDVQFTSSDAGAVFSLQGT